METTFLFSIESRDDKLDDRIVLYRLSLARLRQVRQRVQSGLVISRLHPRLFICQQFAMSETSDLLFFYIFSFFFNFPMSQIFHQVLDVNILHSLKFFVGRFLPAVGKSCPCLCQHG